MWKQSNFQSLHCQFWHFQSGHFKPRQISNLTWYSSALLRWNDAKFTVQVILILCEFIILKYLLTVCTSYTYSDPSAVVHGSQYTVPEKGHFILPITAFPSWCFQSDLNFLLHFVHSCSQNSVIYTAICDSGKEKWVLMVVKRYVTIKSEAQWWVCIILLWKAAGSGGHCFPASFSRDDVIKEYTASNNTNHDCWYSFLSFSQVITVLSASMNQCRRIWPECQAYCKWKL